MSGRSGWVQSGDFMKSETMPNIPAIPSMKYSVSILGSWALTWTENGLEPCFLDIISILIVFMAHCVYFCWIIMPTQIPPPPTAHFFTDAVKMIWSKIIPKLPLIIYNVIQVTPANVCMKLAIYRIVPNRSIQRQNLRKAYKSGQMDLLFFFKYYNRLEWIMFYLSLTTFVVIGTNWKWNYLKFHQKIESPLHF